MNLTDEQKEELKDKIEVEKAFRRSRVLAQFPNDSEPILSRFFRWCGFAGGGGFDGGGDFGGDGGGE